MEIFFLFTINILLISNLFYVSMNSAISNDTRNNQIGSIIPAYKTFSTCIEL